MNRKFSYALGLCSPGGGFGYIADDGEEDQDDAAGDGKAAKDAKENPVHHTDGLVPCQSWKDAAGLFEGAVLFDGFIDSDFTLANLEGGHPDLDGQRILDAEDFGREGALRGDLAEGGVDRVEGHVLGGGGEALHGRRRPGFR